MGKQLDVTLDDDVHDGLIAYLEQEFGNTKAKSLIVNVALRQYLQRKGALSDPKSKPKPGQESFFKEK